MRFMRLILITMLLNAMIAGRMSAATIDPVEFEKFADEQIGAGIAGEQFPGAAIVLVQDGTIAFSRGYGVADLSTQAPVDPQQTAFRVGSISKVVTAAAVLKLVERGQLSLTDEIQPLLKDIWLGEAGESVTIHHLLTHTDGFDVGWGVGGAVRQVEKAHPLKAFLQARIPRRILPPGQMYVYSDVGMALAGRIVEEVDGRSFAQFAQAEIFEPIGMTRSTFVQPPPAKIAERLASGYRRFDDELHRMPFEYIQAVPSAAMTTTPADMARFMLAILHRGELPGADPPRQFLPADLADRMCQTQFTHHAQLPGTAYGLYEHLINGQRALQHGGVLPGYHGLILLLPEHRIGIFFASNGYGGQTNEAFINAFFERFFPAAQRPNNQLAAQDTTPPPEDISGRYRYVQYPHHDIAKLSIFADLVEERKIRLQPDGMLKMDQGLMGPWKPIGPMLYARGDDRLTFRQDERGRTIGMVYNTWAFERIYWFETRRAQIALTQAMIGAFAVGVLARGVSYLRRSKSVGGGAARARDLTAATCAVNLLCLGMVAYSVWGADMFQWYYGLPRLIATARYLPWLSILLTLAAVGWTIRYWRTPGWSRLARCGQLLILGALLIFPAYCIYWNLVALPG